MYKLDAKPSRMHNACFVKQEKRHSNSEIKRCSEEITALREQAQEEIERDKERALQSLRGEVADLAILAAEKVLQENLDASRQRALVDRFIDGLSQSGANPSAYQA